MISKSAPYALLGLLMVTLGACSSTREDRPLLSIIQSFVQRDAEPVALDSQQVDAAVAAVLAATDIPLVLATFEKTQNNVVLRQIASNGPHFTWSDASTTDRRNLSTRDGMLTSTRGLSRDLMSSDVSESLSLLRARTAGTATRVQRYLDGENQIVQMIFQCQIEPGERKRLRIGEIDRQVVRMFEHCTSEDRSLTNVYSVDDAGRIVQSAQWMNDVFGIVVIQQLR